MNKIPLHERIERIIDFYEMHDLKAQTREFVRQYTKDYDVNIVRQHERIQMEAVVYGRERNER